MRLIRQTTYGEVISYMRYTECRKQDNRSDDGRGIGVAEKYKAKGSKEVLSRLVRIISGEHLAQ